MKENEIVKKLDQLSESIAAYDGNTAAALAFVLKLLGTYEDSVKTASEGGNFPELYESESLKATLEYQRTYEEVRKEVRDIGLPVG